MITRSRRDMKPIAVENFEEERDGMDETASIFMEHPIDRLKFHISHTGGKIVKSEFSTDGLAFVIWESQGKQYRAWSSWPDQDYKIDWKAMS
jgi:hypothetical protein